MTANVLASWAGQLVFIVAGFVMPRMTDQHLGPAALGVWDFAWSMVAYFALVQGGIISSANRYVAKYRDAEDMDGVNRAISSLTCVLFIMGAAVAVIAVCVSLAMPWLFGQQLGDFASDARWIILLLGLSMAFQVAMSGYGGVLTGCHRWGIHNAIHAGSRVVAVIGMIAVLLAGRGLVAMAAITLIADAGGRIIRYVAAHRVCPGLHVRPSLASWATAREMLAFGGKTFVPRIGELMMNQTISIVLLCFLGPAALAFYSRPKSLVRHVRTFVTKFSFVLTPTASSLHASGQREQLAALMIKAVRYSIYFSLPMVLLLTISGGPLLRVWMGPKYAQGMLLAVLAVGNFAFLAQLPMVSILAGMNAHGRPGVANLIASICAVAGAVMVLGGGGGLVAVAIAIVVPHTIANGLYVPAYACKKLAIPLGDTIAKILTGPVLCAIPFAICLIAARLALSNNPGAGLLWGIGSGGIILAGLYWRFVLPQSLKQKVAGRFGLTSQPDEESTNSSAKRPSICFVAHNAYGALAGVDDGHAGGIERQQSLMATQLVRLGYSVSMITWDQGQADGIKINGVRVFKMCRRDAGIKGLRFFLPKWTSLWSAMKTANADIYYYNCGDLGLGQVAMWTRLHRRKCVYSVASNPDCDRKLPVLKSIRERMLYRFGLARADGVITQTLGQQKMLREGFRIDSTVIPMPLEDLKAQQPGMADDQQNRVLWVGRFSKEKRLEWLLDVAEQCPNISFDILGAANTNSQYSRELSGRADEIANVNMLGRVPHSYVAQHYRNCKVLCCTSAYEGFPNTFLEAWSLARPVVSTFDPDGIIDRLGLGWTASSVAELADQLQTAINSPQQWQEASQAARSYYEKNHSLHASIAKFDRFFCEIIGEFNSIPAPQEKEEATRESCPVQPIS